jgi:hypothetical protein
MDERLPELLERNHLGLVDTLLLITVSGTVVVGGLLFTDRQLDEQPEHGA